MAKDTLLTIDSKELEDYIKHLKSLDYRSMNNGAASIVRQVATDIKSTYTAATPRRQSKKRTGKYGTTAGNLQRSLRTFRKRQNDPFVIEFSVGYKTHRYGELAAKLSKGKAPNDGYYGWMVNYGVAGRGKGKKSYPNQHFIERARKQANNMIGGKLSERASTFIQRKLEKALVKKMNL